MTTALKAVRLEGQTDYARAWALQRAVHGEVSRGEREDTLLLLEHPHTLTMGRRGGWENLRTSPERLDALGFGRWLIDRGGDITYHGPGQLVGYPIVNMRRGELNIGDFMRCLEQTHIDYVASRGVVADRLAGFPGVWCGHRKITALGVRVTRWTTMHGFAINLNTDLGAFEHILPCGLEGKGVTSLASELREGRVDFEECARALTGCFAQVFERRLEWIEAGELPEVDPREVAAIRAESLVKGAG